VWRFGGANERETENKEPKVLYISFCHTYKILYDYVYYLLGRQNSHIQKADIKNTLNIHSSYRVFRVVKKTEVLNIRLPNKLILELDHLVKKKVFKSRSEAIREFAREYVQEQDLHVTEEKAKHKNSGPGGGRW